MSQLPQHCDVISCFAWKKIVLRQSHHAATLNQVYTKPLDIFEQVQLEHFSKLQSEDGVKVRRDIKIDFSSLMCYVLYYMCSFS